MELRDVSVDGGHCLEEQVGDPATVRALRVHRAMGQGIYAIPESLARMRRLERLSLHQVWGEALALPACLAELPALRELVVDAPAWTWRS